MEILTVLMVMAMKMTQPLGLQRLCLQQQWTQIQARQMEMTTQTIEYYRLPPALQAMAAVTCLETSQCQPT
jgi:hypothetical protein